jgi:hypothetical protein
MVQLKKRQQLPLKPPLLRQLQLQRRHRRWLQPRQKQRAQRQKQSGGLRLMWDPALSATQSLHLRQAPVQLHLALPSLQSQWLASCHLRTMQTARCQCQLEKLLAAAVHHQGKLRLRL